MIGDNLTPEILIGISTHKTVEFRHDQELAIRYFPDNNSIADLRISITSNIHSSLDLSLHIIHPPYFLLSAGLRVVTYVLVLSVSKPDKTTQTLQNTITPYR